MCPFATPESFYYFLGCDTLLPPVALVAVDVVVDVEVAEEIDYRLECDVVTGITVALVARRVAYAGPLLEGFQAMSASFM